jgi:lysophospholipase L1-like esterase
MMETDRQTPHEGGKRRKRLRSLAKDGAIGLAVALLVVVALELGLRVFFPQVLTGASIRGEHFSVDDPELGIRYLPGAIWRFRHPEYTVEYAIDGQGLRDATSRPAKKPPGTIRILLLGDSFTFGQGVDYADTWAVLAEKALARQGLGHVDLIKAGREGMDTRSELLLLRRLAPVYEPDAVVVGFLINDLYTNQPIEGGAEAWKSANPEIYRMVGSAVHLHLATLARRLAISTDWGYVGLYMLNPRRGDYLERPLSKVAQEKLGITQALVRQFAATCDSLGVPLYFLPIPQQFQVLYRPEPGSRIELDLYDREFGRQAQAGGFAWVPAFDAFRASKGGTPLFHRLDGHLTPAGNAVLADVFLRDVVPRVLAQVEKSQTRGTINTGRTQPAGLVP